MKYVNRKINTDDTTNVYLLTNTFILESKIHKQKIIDIFMDFILINVAMKVLLPVPVKRFYRIPTVQLVLP